MKTVWIIAVATSMVFGYATLKGQDRAASQTEPTPAASEPGSDLIDHLLHEYERVQGELDQKSHMYGDHHPEVEQLRLAEDGLVQKLNQLSSITRQVAEDQEHNFRNDLEEMRRQLRTMTHRIDVSPDSLEAATRSLDDQLQTLQIQQQGTEAGRAAIEKILHEHAASTQSSAASDPLQEQLESLAALQKEKLDRISREQAMGVANLGEVAAARYAYEEAQVKVAEYKQSLQASAGSDALAGLRAKLVDMDIESSERQATVQAIQDRLEKLRSSSESSAQYRLFEHREQDAEEELRQAERDTRRIDRELTVLPPVPVTAQPATAGPSTTEPASQH